MLVSHSELSCKHIMINVSEVELEFSRSTSHIVFFVCSWFMVRVVPDPRGRTCSVSTEL